MDKEKQAKELYNSLLKTFADSSPAPIIAINEPGLHWNCTIYRFDRECIIYCFGEKGFAVSYKINDILKARGRTRLQNELISSVDSWLGNSNLNELLDNFEFIDPGKRTLEKFRDKLIKDYPGLGENATIEIGPGLRETFDLKITSTNRYCHIHFYKDRKIPTCECYWEDFYVFEFVLDNTHDSALIIKRWFCDNVIPSDLAEEFSFLGKVELSKYFNFTKVIETDFIRSWDTVEKFYSEYSLLFKQDHSKILGFISQLRKKDYDRIFRAGISVTALVLSRAKHHGLKPNQPCLIFEFSDEDKINIYTSERDRFDGKINLCSPNFEITPKIESFLKELEKKIID